MSATLKADRHVFAHFVYMDTRPICSTYYLCRHVSFKWFLTFASSPRPCKAKGLYPYYGQIQVVFKKSPNVCYKEFILHNFKHCPLQSNPLSWRYTVPNVSSIVGMLPGTHFLWWLPVLLSHFPESPRVKKILNFLNSAPTSKEGALRLLSAPSVRFWQQTSIYPVSLWALVVELHPLNWVRSSD
jgi:hypothetical protein